MWTMWTTLLVFSSALSALSANQNTTDQQQIEDPDRFFSLIGQPYDSFEWRLWTALANGDRGNMVISPISVKLLLKMLYEGSTGVSSDELGSALSLPRDKSISRMQSSSIIRSLQTPNPEYNMQIGSKIFITENISPKNWYQRILYLYYNAYIEKLDFTDGKSAMDRINNWVRYITHGYIKDFLASDDGLESTVMLLINAIYFKGSWTTPFAKGDTFEGRFQTPEGPKDVLFMSQINYFYYSRSEKLKAQILRLPYLGDKFSMYLILPEKKDGLNELIRNLDPMELRKQVFLMDETSLEVILPKFKIDYKTALKETLGQLGIRKIFNSYDDMKGLTRNNKIPKLVVSNVIQKASIDVNEEGSVAAAATEFQLINKFGGSDELFNASHPFLFFIEDESTSSIVFIGKIVNPTGYEVKKPTTAPSPIRSTPTPMPLFQRRVPQIPFPGNKIRRSRNPDLLI